MLQLTAMYVYSMFYICAFNYCFISHSIAEKLNLRWFIMLTFIFVRTFCSLAVS